MRTLLAGLAGVVVTAALAVVTPITGTASATAPLAPTHTVDVIGDGVATYPAFDPSVSRYGVTTTADTDGTLTVHATSTDPGATVYVDGRPAPDGTRTVTGLQTGDEVAVFIQDSAGTARYSYVYLPADFPTIERVTPDPVPGALAPGQVLMTLARFVAPSPYFETAVDLNGVPSFVKETPTPALDLSPQPNGRISVFETNPTPGAGSDLIEYDAQWREVARHRTVGLTNTDSHDAIVLPDGTVWLMAYEPRPNGLIDAVIQRVDPDGHVGFEWNSKNYVNGDSVSNDAATQAVRDDYAHINSFQIMDDGDLLVSFRHFSSVWKIATHAHDGFHKGDVVWKLGGRFSDFTFAAGDLGPCAQHTARELPNGDILMFDNGSWNDSTAFCVDPSDPTGPPVQRVQTRVVQYHLDEQAHTATVVSSYQPTDWFTIFAGSAQQLPNGDRMIGWAENTDAMASEIDADGNLLWEIRDPVSVDPDAHAYFTYRALKTVVPDAIPPTVTVQVPAEGATYVEGELPTPSFDCTDRGGSSLQTCTAAPLDPTPGAHTELVTATDGAGGTTTVSRHYSVLPTSWPDVMARAKGTPAFTGDGVVGAPQQLRSRVKGQRATLVVKLRNEGVHPDQLTWKATEAGPFRLARPRHGTTPLLAPGATYTVKLGIRRPRAVADGHTGTVLVEVGSTSSARTDALTWRLKAR